jgi:antitoxin component of MazEF toxin-antitoxin module
MIIGNCFVSLVPASLLIAIGLKVSSSFTVRLDRRCAVLAVIPFAFAVEMSRTPPNAVEPGSKLGKRKFVLKPVRRKCWRCDDAISLLACWEL